MEILLIISKSISIIYLVIALGLIFSRGYYRKEFPSMITNSSFLFLGGLMAIVIGIFILSNSEIEHFHYVLLFKLIGYLAVLKGGILIVFPQIGEKYKKMFSDKRYLKFIIIPFLIILSFIFGYIGFI